MSLDWGASLACGKCRQRYEENKGVAPTPEWCYPDCDTLKSTVDYEGKCRFGCEKEFKEVGVPLALTTDLCLRHIGQYTAFGNRDNWNAFRRANAQTLVANRGWEAAKEWSDHVRTLLHVQKDNMYFQASVVWASYCGPGAIKIQDEWARLTIDHLPDPGVGRRWIAVTDFYQNPVRNTSDFDTPCWCTVDADGVVRRFTEHYTSTGVECYEHEWFTVSIH
jgi:hypothetical protein